MPSDTSSGDTERDEVRLRVTDTDETGVAEISIYDCGYTNPMKEDYAVTGSAELIITIDGGRFEVVEDDG